MLSARYIASLSDELIELYSQMEFEIKKDIFRRLNRLGKVTDSVLYQTELLQETGGLNADVKKILNFYDSKAKKQLRLLYKEALKKSIDKDLSYYKMAGRKLSDNQIKSLNALIDHLIEPDNPQFTVNKTYAARITSLVDIEENLIRLTRTVADNTEKAFIKAANKSYLEVSTGAKTWQKAYKESVLSIARDYKPITTYSKGEPQTIYHPVVTYSGSGTIRQYSIESAVRSNIMTGINQTCSQVTWETNEELGNDLVEVSAHLGARPFHAELQGKVYCLNGEREYIDGNGQKQFAPNFQETCHFGEPDGICGINCRHSFYPYFEGMPAEYSNGELSEMKDNTVKLNGKEVTQYEAEQDLRNCERNIRHYKQEITGLEIGKQTDAPEYMNAKNKLYEWQQNARNIVEETGIRRSYTNEYIGTKDGKQPKGIKPKE